MNNSHLQVQFFATHILLSREHNVRNVGVVCSKPQSISSSEQVFGGPQGSQMSSHRSKHCWWVISEIAPTTKTRFVRMAKVRTFLIIICDYPINEKRILRMNVSNLEIIEYVE